MMNLRSFGDRLVKFGLILIVFAGGFHSSFNFAAETILLVRMISKQASDQLQLDVLCMGDGIAPYVKFGIILISAWGRIDWGFISAADGLGN